MGAKEVLDAVYDERRYQQRKWAEADAKNSVGDFIVYMQRELEKARDAYRSPVDSVEDAMAGIRKATTVGVAAMEKFGTGTAR